MMSKALDTTNSSEARHHAPDIKFFGNPDAWGLVSKASSASQGWMKSTKRMKVDGGWLYQVTTEFREIVEQISGGVRNTYLGKVTSCAEALTFVPDATDTIAKLTSEIARLTQEAESWKRRAAKHGCDVEKGDPDCG